MRRWSIRCVTAPRAIDFSLNAADGAAIAACARHPTDGPVAELAATRLVGVHHRMNSRKSREEEEMSSTRILPRVSPGAVVEKLLGSIVCTPSKAAAGEPVCVEVRAPDGVPYDNRESIPISINGVPGTKQYLTWQAPGTHTITVIAHRRRAPETLSTTIEIGPRADGAVPPALRVRAAADKPGVFQLALEAGPRLRTKPVGPRPVTAPAAPGSAAVAAVAAPTLPTVPRARPKIRIPRPRTPSTPLLGGGTLEATHQWDLHGVKLGTMQTSVSHDFRARLEPNRVYQVFHVSLTERPPEGPPVTHRRSITVWNEYALMRRRGVLQPTIMDADASARFTGQGYRAKLKVRNPESFDLILTGRRIERVWGTATSRGPDVLGEEPIHIVLKARESTNIVVQVAKSQLPPQAEAFAAHFVGKAPNGMPVRVTAHFDLPQHVSKRHQVPADVQKALADLGRRNLISSERTTSIAELREIESQRLLPAGFVSRLTGGNAPRIAPPYVHREPPKAVEGEECDPWNLPAVIPDGLVCMPTQETRSVLMPPRFMNAKKGDLVLSPGDGGLIAKVLAAVEPPQPYSHSGIMTRNRDEVTHSTASEDRIMDEYFAGSDGIRPDALKYLWPGVITQSVDLAVNGEKRVDPETGKEYTIGGFSSMESADSAATAMVVKPDPLTETPALRAKLHEIADWAAKQAGRSHYRFYCYTDPTIGLTETAPASAKWAAGTFPTVCSSLIWMAIRQSGVKMEGALEPADIDGGAQITVKTPDGLYVYQADERLAAGQVLYNTLYQLVKLTVGDLGVALTDVADDISNQILNSFASDWSDEDAKDSEKWRETTDANAVSPQNLMFYDNPLYGYSEPLIFRDWRVEEVTIYKWKKVVQTGSLKGVVRYQGKPVKGAHVQISEKQFAYTDANGAYKIDKVPVGQMVIEAQKEQGGMLLTATVKAPVTANHATTADVNLHAPSHLFRRLRIEGSMRTKDWEFAAAVDPTTTRMIEGYVDLDPSTATHGVKTFDNHCDDAVGRVYFNCDLKSDGTVVVKVKIRCYHQSEPTGDDYTEGNLNPIEIKPGKSWSGWIYAEDGNRAEAHFTLINRTNAS